jgi:phosphoheptose isomerase
MLLLFLQLYSMMIMLKQVSSPDRDTRREMTHMFRIQSTYGRIASAIIIGVVLPFCVIGSASAATATTAAVSNQSVSTTTIKQVNVIHNGTSYGNAQLLRAGKHTVCAYNRASSNNYGLQRWRWIELVVSSPQNIVTAAAQDYGKYRYYAGQVCVSYNPGDTVTVNATTTIDSSIDRAANEASASFSLILR